MIISYPTLITWIPLIATVCDAVASVLVVSAVLEFSKKRADRDQADYMENEFLVAKQRTLVALVPITISCFLNVILGIHTIRHARSP